MLLTAASCAIVSPTAPAADSGIRFVGFSPEAQQFFDKYYQGVSKIAGPRPITACLLRTPPNPQAGQKHEKIQLVDFWFDPPAVIASFEAEVDDDTVHIPHALILGPGQGEGSELSFNRGPFWPFRGGSLRNQPASKPLKNALMLSGDYRTLQSVLSSLHQPGDRWNPVEWVHMDEWTALKAYILIQQKSGGAVCDMTSPLFGPIQRVTGGSDDSVGTKECVIDGLTSSSNIKDAQSLQRQAAQWTGILAASVDERSPLPKPRPKKKSVQGVRKTRR